jgi:hypothetical protein
MEGAELREILNRCEDLLRKGCRQTMLDNSTIGLDDLRSRIKDQDTLFLQVNTEGSSQK